MRLFEKVANRFLLKEDIRKEIEADAVKRFGNKFK